MADPITQVQLAWRLLVHPGPLGILVSLFGGAAKADAYKYQSSMAMVECRDCQAEPKYALDIGEQQAEKAGIAGAAQAGQIKAAQGASGVDVNYGSAKKSRLASTLSPRWTLTPSARRPRRLQHDFRCRRRTTRTKLGLFQSRQQCPELKCILGAVSSFLSALPDLFLPNGCRDQQLGLWGMADLLSKGEI